MPHVVHCQSHCGLTCDGVFHENIGKNNDGILALCSLHSLHMLLYRKREGYDPCIEDPCDPLRSVLVALITIVRKYQTCASQFHFTRHYS